MLSNKVKAACFNCDVLCSDWPDVEEEKVDPVDHVVEGESDALSTESGQDCVKCNCSFKQLIGYSCSSCV